LLVTVKFAVVAPAAKVTDAGTVAAFKLLLVRVTTAPPAGATVVRVTVPALPAPPVIDVGFSAIVEACGGLATSVTILEAPLHVAVIFTEVGVVTAFVATAKVADVVPAATVTEAGTVATPVLLLASVTTAPPAGAALNSVTVPVLAAPPVSTTGFSVIEESSGFTTSPIALETPLYAAVMVTTVPVVTGLVVIVNVAVDAPAGTVTDAGTVAAFVLLLVSVITAPPTVATAVIVTVPVLLAPPTRVPGLTAIEANAGAAIRTTNPSAPPAETGWMALANGKLVDDV
jgi:hypothetical protein